MHGKHEIYGKNVNPPTYFLTIQTLCRALIGLTIHAKMVGGGRPLKRKFCIK